jgi:hypothetical protein
MKLRIKINCNFVKFMKNHTKITFIFLFISIITHAQCAMCKAVVENGDAAMAEGVNSGITFLMLFPYLFLVLGIIIYYRNKKRADKKL